MGWKKWKWLTPGCGNRPSTFSGRPAFRAAGQSSSRRRARRGSRCPVCSSLSIAFSMLLSYVWYVWNATAKCKKINKIRKIENRALVACATFDLARTAHAARILCKKCNKKKTKCNRNAFVDLLKPNAICVQFECTEFMERYKIAAQLNACLGNAGWWDERPTHLLLASRTICDWLKRVHTLRVHGSIALCSQLGSAAEKLTDGGVLYMWSSRRTLSLQQRQFFGCALPLSPNESCKKFCTLTLVMVRSRAALSIQQWESCRLYSFALHVLFAFSRALSLFVRHAAEALHMHSQSLTACNANVLSPKIFAKSAIAHKHTNKAMRVYVCVCA